ncbi:MAG: hypothetical protein MZV64_49980 [Ignavibacteriales bacterium]|nr:hypothetical protein [Ignavibacteriales bacterium]
MPSRMARKLVGASPGFWRWRGSASKSRGCSGWNWTPSTALILRVLDRLDDPPVARAGDGHEALAHPLEGLVMRAQDARVVGRLEAHLLDEDALCRRAGASGSCSP